MLADQFKGILDTQLQRVRDILVVKTEEYATEDQLANVRMMAQIQGVSLPRAVAGAMAKHTFSVYKMVRDGKAYPIEAWDEKITDHIIWLILLRAALIENAQNPLEADAPDVLRAHMAKNPHAFVEVGDSLVISDTGYQIPAAEILRFAAMILETPSTDPPKE